MTLTHVYGGSNPSGAVDGNPSKIGKTGHSAEGESRIDSPTLF